MKADVNPTTVHLDLRYELFAKAKANVKLDSVFTIIELRDKVLEMFNAIDAFPTHHLISISISVGSFSHQTKKALNLFTVEHDVKKIALNTQAYKIAKKYGLDSLRWGSEL